MANALVSRAIEIIRANQASSGAYIASPNFPPYRYAWFRDGAFVAYAMDGVGETASAARFHDWAAATIAQHAAQAHAGITRARRGESLKSEEGLHTRYALDGAEGDEIWPNFQLDGLGTWLWSAVEYLKRHDDVSAATRWSDSLHLAADYLGTLWRVPNYDCWEEFGDRVHVSTLSALYGGLRAFADWQGDPARAHIADEIRAFVLEEGVREGHLIKFLGNLEVDASLLGAAIPYHVLAVDDPLMAATIEKIERDLRRDGAGVHRYAADSYYGGGEWVLLTAWLGWYYAACGEVTRARDCLAWVVAQADAQGELPEQVPVNLNVPSQYSEWLMRWGPIAKPLLWSHAQFLILWKSLNDPSH